MHKSEKERVIAELTERLRVSPTLIVADYRGLTMPEIDGLRGELLKHGARFSVVKNTLTRRAAEAAGADAVLAMLEGPTAIAFLESEGDPVAVAKALADAVKTTKILVIRGGVLDGKVISADDVDSLAKLPPTDVLRAQLVSALAGPLTAVVGIFAAPLRDLVGVIDARIEQLKEQGETVPEPEPELVSEPEPDVLMSTSEPEPAPEPAPGAEAEPEAEAEVPSEEPEAEAESPSDEAQED